jgi:autotransporter-associated beta strand protein
VWPVLTGAVLGLAVASTQAAVKTWDGSFSGNWSTAANWAGGVAPVNGDDLVFQGGAANLLNTNNYPSLRVKSVTFTGSGYTLHGNALVVTNGVSGQQGAPGANTIEFPVTLGAAQTFDCVNAGASLTFNGALTLGAFTVTFGGTGNTTQHGLIGGTGGLIKSGAGRLLLAGSVNNTYSGLTTVTAGILELNDTLSATAMVPGDLTISGGKVLLTEGNQIADTAEVTISGSGLLDLNNFDETIGPSLTLNDGDVQTGTGLLSFSGNPTISVSGNSSVSGRLSVGSGSCTIQGSGLLDMRAEVSGAAGIVKNGTVALRLHGANTFTGSLTANTSGYVEVLDSRALGATNGGTIINDSVFLALTDDLSITNEALTMNSSHLQAIYVGSSSTNVWTGTFILNADTMVYVASNCALELVGPITGLGGMTKWGPGRLRYSGSTANTYSGPTVVEDGLLELKKSSGNAIPQDLSIGGGSGISGVVQHLAHNQIANTADITFQTNAILNLNSFNDTVASLTFNGGRIDTGAGILYLNSGAGITVNPTNVSAVINGTLSLSLGIHTFAIGAGIASPDLDLNADIIGLGSMTLTGDGGVHLHGDNTYSGDTTLNGVVAWAYSDTALGSTAGATIINSNSSFLRLVSANIGNETLTINRSPGGGWYTLYAEGSCSWGGPIILNNDAQFFAYNTFILSNPISGAGSLDLHGDTYEFAGASANTYAGTTEVHCKLLRLNKTGALSSIAVPANLIIGYGTAVSNVVRLLDNDQIINTATVTLNTNGVLDLGSFGDVIRDLVCTWGRVDGPAGLLSIDSSITVNGAVNGTDIRSKVNLRGATITMDVNTIGPVPNLAFWNEVRGVGNLVKTGNGLLSLHASNSFTGTLTINSGTVQSEHDYALGAVSGGTVVNSGGTLYFGYGANTVVEPITLNGTGDGGNGAMVLLGDITLKTNVVLASDALIKCLPDSSYHGIIEGVISGNGGFTKIGLGTLRLTGAIGNSYLGDTFLNEGLTELAKTSGTGAAVRYGRLTIGDGTGGADADVARYLADGQLWSSVPVTITSSGLLDVNGHVDTVGALTFTGGRATTGTGGKLSLYGNVVATNGSGTIQGNLELPATRTFDAASTRALYLEANVSGAGGLTKTSRGLMYLSGSNSYSGLTLINDGAVYAEHNFAFGTTNSGTTVSSGASLYLRNGVSIGLEPLTVVGDGVSGFAAGAFVSRDGSNAWAGPITLAGDTRISVGSGSVTTDYLNLSGAIGGTGNLTKDFLGTLLFSGSTSNTYAGSTLVNAGTLVLSKTVTSKAVPGALIIGDGLGGADADKVQVLDEAQIGNSAAVTINSSGLLQINLTFEEIIGSLAGSGHLDLSMVGSRIDTGGNGDSTLFSGGITGVGRLLKEGNGTMTLSGNNTYTGYTHVDGGILLVNGSQPSSPVTVYSLATLGGLGTVGTITSDGTVSPGTSPGTLTSSNVVLSATSIFAVELTGTGSDQLNVRGANNLGGATLQLTTSGLSPTEGQTFTILNNDSADPIVGIFAGLPEGGIVSAGAYQFAISYTGGTGNDVTLTSTNTAIQVASVTISAGNGNGVVDANECNFLNVVVTNTSAYTLSGMTAQLTPVSPGVAVTYPVSAYPDIVPARQGTNGETFQFTTWPGFAASCGSNVQLQLTVQSASHGTFTLPVTLPSGSPGTPLQYSNVNPYGIPDGGSVTSTIPVAGFSGPLAKVTVSLFATHGLDADLDMYLIGPDGTMVELSTDNGGTGNSYGTACTPSTSRTTFDDSALNSITAGTAPFTGTYRPEGSLSAFRGKAGAAVNGTWKLVLTDDTSNGQFGALNCWYLDLYNATCTDGGGVCESCPERVILGAITTGSQAQDGRLAQAGTPSACGSSKSYPGKSGTGTPSYYDAYTFLNGESNACITVSLSSAASLFSGTYVNTYDPANLALNYLADMANSVSGGSTNSYAFNVAAFATFVVVVNQVNPTDLGNYVLSVTGGSCRPLLKITPADANRVAVGWSTAAIGYQLMQTNTLGGPPSQPWTPVVANPIVTDSKLTVTNHTILLGPQRFYELRKP